MNFAHLHLLLNHFPITALLFGFSVLAIGRLKSNETIIRVALGILVVGGFVAGAAFLTGDRAADLLMQNPTYSKKMITEHDQAAGFGLWSTIITACTAAGGLYLSQKKGAAPKRYLLIIFILNFWALTVIARTNYLGGQISHPETRFDSK
jgi:uncharacterized membrane protein